MPRQQVFRSQRQDGKRQIMMPVDEIANRPVSSRRDQADEVVAKLGLLQPLIEPCAIRKQAWREAACFQFTDELPEPSAPTTAPGPRIPLNDDPLLIHASKRSRSSKSTIEKCRLDTSLSNSPLGWPLGSLLASLSRLLDPRALAGPVEQEFAAAVFDDSAEFHGVVVGEAVRAGAFELGAYIEFPDE
jgi:hypothetical protein